jgi:hypothetical protein
MLRNLIKPAQVAATSTATALCLSLTVGHSAAQARPSAPAPVDPLNGWDYAIADFGNGSGGSIFDYQGIAIKDTGTDLFVAVNTNMRLTGENYQKAKIAYGDLFFNFTGKTMKEASDAQQLVGIRFAPADSGSDSGAASVGVYENVRAKSAAQLNYGWQNLDSYTAWTKKNRVGNSYGDLTSTDSYFNGQRTGNYTLLTSIGDGKNSGTKVGNIMMLSSQQLGAAGLDFSKVANNQGKKVTGTQTIGFSFKKTAAFKPGQFIATLFAECGNDGLAIRSTTKRKVPEPTAMLGLAAVGTMGLLRRSRRRTAS